MNVKEKLPHLFAVKIDNSYNIFSSKNHAVFDQLVNVINSCDEKYKTCKRQVVALKTDGREKNISLIRHEDKKIFNLYNWFYTNKGLDIGMNISIIPVIHFNKDINDISRY